MPLEFSMSAKNSSGIQRLIFIVEEDKTLYPCLYGEYEGKDIQIDFDGLTIDDVNELIRYLELRRNDLNDTLKRGDTNGNLTEKK